MSAATSVSEAAGVDSAPYAARPIKVMVIDDSKTIRRTAETLLKKLALKSSPQTTVLCRCRA